MCNHSSLLFLSVKVLRQMEDQQSSADVLTKDSRRRTEEKRLRTHSLEDPEYASLSRKHCMEMIEEQWTVW